MGQIAKALVQAAHRDVVVEGIHYRLQKVSSADILEAGGAFLLALPTAAPGQKEGDADKKKRGAAIARQIEADPKLKVKSARFKAAVVAAGVVAASEDGKSWEELRVVLDRRQQDPDQNRVFIRAYSTAAVMAFPPQLLARSGAGGGAAEWLAPFRGDAARAPARPRKAVRH